LDSVKRTSQSPSLKIAFSVIVLVVSAAAATALFLAYRLVAPPRGADLNRLAWEANFRERGLAVPVRGPRDGYWGAAMPAQVKVPDLGWKEAEVHLPGRVEEDRNGMQSFDVPGPRWHILIIGGSVAWGAYASSIETTYFALVARELAAKHLPVRITVLAAGAWTSENELAALQRRSPALRPDIVILLDGLNDLMMRAGSADQRAADYLVHVRAFRDAARAEGATVVLALQPFLLQKHMLTALEERVLELSVDAATPVSLLRTGYSRLRSGLALLAQQEGTVFLDCSDSFDDERATTFTDIWHFADPGHRLLADRLVQGLTPVLARMKTD
jgi:lysophospholipase L1-like esterase